MRSLAALIVLATTALAQQCYYPAGNPSNDVPCGGSTGSCCPSKSQCLSNGLCAVSGSQFQRSSCTDQAWGSSCFQQCYKTSYPGSPWTNTANVFACSGGSSYCCETAIDQGTGCCSGTTFQLAAGAPIAAPSPSKKPAAVIALQETITTPSTTSSTAAVTTITSSSTTSSTTSSSEASTYTTTALFGGNSTSTIASASIRPSPSNNGTLAGSGGGVVSTPTAPLGGPAPTGAASTLSQTGFALVVVAVAGWIVL